MFLGIEGKAVLAVDNKYILHARIINIHKKILLEESHTKNAEQLESNFKSIEEHYFNMGWVVVRESDFKIFTPSTP